MWPCVMLLSWMIGRVGWRSRVLLVLHASSRAKPVCQVVGVFGVAAAVFHTVCAHDCAVETCRQAGKAGREKINDLEAENQQLYVNTVVRVSAVIIPDAEQAFADSGAPFIVTQHTNFAQGKWEKLLGSTNIWKGEQRRDCQVPAVSTTCPFG